MLNFILSLLIITKTINCLNGTVWDTCFQYRDHGNQESSLDSSTQAHPLDLSIQSHPLDLSIKTNPSSLNDVKELRGFYDKDSPRLLPSSSKKEHSRHSSKETLKIISKQNFKHERRNVKVRTITKGREKMSYRQRIENFLKEFEVDKPTAINPNKIFFSSQKRTEIIFQTKLNIKLKENIYKHIFLYIDEKSLHMNSSSDFRGKRASNALSSAEPRYFFIPEKKLRVITFETRNLLEDLFLDGGSVDLSGLHNKRLFENVSPLKSKTYHLIKKFDAAKGRNLGFLYVTFEYVALQEAKTKGLETREAEKLSVTLNIEHAPLNTVSVEASSFWVSSIRTKFSIKEEDTSEGFSQGGSHKSNQRGNTTILDVSPIQSYKGIQLLKILKSLKMDMEILTQEAD